MGRDGNIGLDKSRQPVRIEPSFGIYAEQHEVFDLLSEMTKDLIMHLPEDPLSHMISFLKQPLVPRIFVHGPLGSGRRILCDLIAEKTDAVHLNVDDIVTAAIEVETTHGSAAAQYVKQGVSIPNHTLAQIVVDRLNEGDCKRNGYVLRGFPKTREQAVALQTRGVLPTHVFVFEGVTEALSTQYLQNTMMHPKSQRTYHSTLFPPPPEVAEECTAIPSTSQNTIADALEEYRQNFVAFCATYKSVMFTLNADQPVADLFADVWNRLCTKRQSNAPFIPRIVISGPLGSGDQDRANELAKKYNAVAVHMHLVLQKAIDLGDAVSRSIKTSLKHGTPILDSTLESLVKKELSSIECQTRGWILTGYPKTTIQARSLCAAGFEPNRAFYLEVDKNVALARYEGRRVDPVSGKTYHLKFNPPPNEKVASRLKQHPHHHSDAIHKALDKYEGTFEEIKACFPKIVCVDANFDDNAVQGYIDGHLVRPHLDKVAL